MVSSGCNSRTGLPLGCVQVEGLFYDRCIKQYIACILYSNLQGRVLCGRRIAIMLDQFVEKLPEADREAYKAAIKSAVIITSPEDVDKLFESHPTVKSVVDSRISRKYAEIEKKYQDEKVPKLVQEKLAEELKKGQKQPWEVEIEKLRAENVREKQKARALLKAQEQGIPSELVERFIGDSDEATDEALKTLGTVLTPWREKAVKDALAKFGNMPDPKAGDLTGKSIKRADFDRLDPDAKMKLVREKYAIVD